MLRSIVSPILRANARRIFTPLTRPTTPSTIIVRRYSAEGGKNNNNSNNNNNNNNNKNNKITPEQKERNKRVGIWAVAIILATLGLSYAAVPLYRMFCKATGYGGTVKKTEKLKTISYPDHDDKPRVVRPITINFNSDISDKLAWEFKPLQSSMTVIPGEPALACYLATNNSDHHVIGRAGAYFNKIQCFCFEEQRLKPHETVEMPVWFFIDPDFEEDVNVSNIRTLTLSYTFYKSDYVDE